MSLPVAIGLGVSRARSLLGCVASSLVTCGASLVHVMLLVFTAGVAALHGLWAGTLDATVFVLVVTYPIIVSTALLIDSLGGKGVIERRQGMRPSTGDRNAPRDGGIVSHVRESAD